MRAHPGAVPMWPIDTPALWSLTSEAPSWNPWRRGGAGEAPARGLTAVDTGWLYPEGPLLALAHLPKLPTRPETGQRLDSDLKPRPDLSWRSVHTLWPPLSLSGLNQWGSKRRLPP